MYISIFIFGDSIAWGCWDDQKGGWADRLKLSFLPEDQRKSFRVYVYNLGVGADNTKRLLEKFEDEIEARATSDIEQRKFDIIIFAVGANDSLYLDSKDNPRVSFERFQKNLSKLAKQAKSFTPKIIFIGLTKVDESKTMPPFWNNKIYYDNENIKRYNSGIQNFCKKNNLYFIPMLDLLNKDDLEDGLHPNVQGHQKMFERVKDFLIENKLVKR